MRRCEVCKYMDENSLLKSSQDDPRYSMNFNFKCNSSNIVYLITCKKWLLQYMWALQLGSLDSDLTTISLKSESTKC